MDERVKEFNRIITDAELAARNVYIAAIRDVLRKCPSLRYFMDAGGTYFFVKQNGDIVHEWSDLPETAQAISEIANQYQEYFGSMGLKVYRNTLG